MNALADKPQQGSVLSCSSIEFPTASARKTVLENGIPIVTESIPDSHSVSMGPCSIVGRTMRTVEAYGRAIASTLDSVTGLTREVAIYFVYTQYTPDRMTISTVGEVNHDDYVAYAWCKRAMR